MKAKIIVFLLFGVFITSCTEEAKIQVTNQVHNVQLNKISFSGEYIGTNLYSGETTEATIKEGSGNDISFPVKAPLEFYMVKGDKTVYLKTKEYFHLDKDETLKIVISDDTELINPMN
jgi:hypothetical protein